MGLVKIVAVSDVARQGRVVKEVHDGRTVVMVARDQHFECWECPDASYANHPNLEQVGQAHQVYHDDGHLWINLASSTAASPAPKGSAAQRRAAVGEGYGLGSAFTSTDTVHSTAPPPAPLVPFAGCYQKPLPPSPAKFGAQARTDSQDEDRATRGSWAARQAAFEGAARQATIHQYFQPLVMDADV